MVVRPFSGQPNFFNLNFHEMKKKFIFLQLALCLAGPMATGQDYEPTTTWPYLYPEFADGVLEMPDGGQRQGLYNVCILEGRLHFIDGELVKEANPADFLAVEIGSDRYVNAGGTVMKVLASSDKGIVAQETAADISRLNETGGAYGSSSTSMATTALSSIDFGPRVNVNHMVLKNSKSDGKILPVTTRLYLLYGKNVIYATKKDVSETEGVDREGFKTFCKENKIKWKDPQSLLQVIGFLAGASEQ